MAAEKPKTGKAGKRRLFPTSKGEFEMMVDYTEEKMDGPIEAVAAALTQVTDYLLTLRVGDMVVIARQDDGVFVACQRNLFPEGDTLGEACRDQKLQKYVDEMNGFLRGSGE